MIYSSEELKSKDFDHKTAMQRYLFKFLNQKKEFHKLKAHEKDYAFGWMKVTYNDKNEKAFNLYEESEAFEFVFFNIILKYGEDVDSFEGCFSGPYGIIPKAQVQRDKVFFHKYLQTWKTQLDNHKGIYLSIIAPMFRQKMKEIAKVCTNSLEQNSRELYCYSVFFYVYYKAKLYFDEKTKKSIVFDINGYKFVANVYSFCHILTRHYIPSINRGLDNSMNDNLDIIKTDSLMDSLKYLIEKYFSVYGHITRTTEYLLFKLNGFCYILWLKYKQLDELSKREGFEIRSFYRCYNIKDLSLFEKTTDVTFEDGIKCSIPMSN